MKTENSESFDNNSPETLTSNEHEQIESPIKVPAIRKVSIKLEIGNSEEQNSMINISSQQQHYNFTDDSFGLPSVNSSAGK